MINAILLFLGNFSAGEILIVFFVILLLFGGKKLPELARGLGKGIREFKDASQGIRKEIETEIDAEGDKKK
jgi:sec-independent protein translocase protein TatA